jgi:uncharacterized protein (DUF1697 family)
MPRYVALLRGVSPQNAKMPALKACFESMGFTDVTTVLSSGNIVFTSAQKSETSLATTIEVGMEQQLARSFPVLVRTSAHLRSVLQADPYSAFRIPPNAKRVVTFLNQAHSDSLLLPIEFDGAKILAVREREVFTVYVPSERGPVFMTLIEKTFGKSVTTRTWDTVKKCAAL